MRTDKNRVDVFNIDEIELWQAEFKRRVQIDSVVELFELIVDDAGGRVSVVGHVFEPLVVDECLRDEVFERAHVERAVEHDGASFACEHEAWVVGVAV